MNIEHIPPIQQIVATYMNKAQMPYNQKRIDAILEQDKEHAAYTQILRDMITWNRTQSDLAKRFDVSVSYINKVIRGKVPPSEKLIQQITPFSNAR